MAQPKRNADCHTERPHYGNGLCAPCWGERYRETKKPKSTPYGKRDRAKIRANNIRYKYGIDPVVYLEMVKQQGGKCAICKKQPMVSLCIDHCHLTNSIRGLLCTTCNKAIGALGDSVEGLTAALNYLIRHRNSLVSNTTNLSVNLGV